MRKPAFLALTLLAATVLAGCGHPHVRNHPLSPPQESGLAGTYKLAHYNGDVNVIQGGTMNDAAQILLRPDHSAQVSAVPQFGAQGGAVICRLSGPAKWGISSGPLGWDLMLKLDALPKTLPKPSPRADSRGSLCQRDFRVRITGQHPPYSLYYAVGDAGRNTGIEYRRVSP